MTVLEVCTYSARPCLRYVSTVLEAKLTVLNHAGGMFRPCSRYVLTVLDRAGGMFRPCSRYVLTVLDRAGGMFRPRSTYVLTVLIIDYLRLNLDAGCNVRHSVAAYQKHAILFIQPIKRKK